MSAENLKGCRPFAGITKTSNEGVVDHSTKVPGAGSTDPIPLKSVSADNSPLKQGAAGQGSLSLDGGFITPDKKILYLTLYRKWFELIASRKKFVEYRDVKPHWEKRLRHKVTHEFIQFDLIVFRVGYSRSSPTVITEHRGTTISPFDKTQYFIRLGRVLYVRR